MIGELKLDIDDKKLMTRYLLGELSEEDSARLEDSSFSDPDQLEKLWAVENDLIDEYARNELTTAERENFERLFLAHPDRRQRVEFALALARLSPHRVRAGSSEGALKRSGSLVSFFRLPRLAWAFGTAALLIILAAGVWWLFTRTSSRPGEQLAQQKEPGQPPSGETHPGSSPQTNINGQRPEPPPKAGNGIDNSGPERSRPTPAAPRQPTVVTFVLPRGLSRSSSDRTTMIVAHGCQLMLLRLELEEHEALKYEVFAADLNRAGVAVWQVESAVIHPPKQNRTLVLRIPVQKLAMDTADYELTLKGRASKGQPFENLSFYYLTIVKK